jgi:ribosome recycling factor
MPVKETLSLTKESMNKSVEFFKSQLAKVRTGRATTSLVDGVKVDYYGTMSPISQTATVSTPDARTIMIQPFDRTMISEIEKAIRQADLGFNPQNDGTVIRIPVPPLTEERRKEFVKLCKKYGEEAKIAVRNNRRDGLDMLREYEKEKEISEDDLKRGEDDVQKITDEFVKKIDELTDKKEKELMED